MEYAIVIEKSATGYSAYVPDLSGCIATAQTEAQVRRLIRKGILIYLDELRIAGEPIPRPTTRVEYVEITEAVPVA